MSCPTCLADLTLDVEREMKMCATCATKFGVRPMPPALRPPAPCMRCGKLKFVRVIPREYTSRDGGETNAQVAVPMFLTYVPKGNPTNKPGGWLNGPQPLDMNDGHGLLEAYACIGCGFVEWYCHDALDIPLSPYVMSELIDYGKGGPYR